MNEEGKERLLAAVDVLTDLAVDFASLTIAKERAERKQAQAEQALISANSMAASLRADNASLLEHQAADHESLREADRLLNLALHLRMHGENAPGGTETWRRFDRECEHYLRWGTGSSEVPQVGYSPVQVPENTGKHPGESGDIVATGDMDYAHGEALRENWCRDAVAAAGKSWDTHMVKFDGTVLPR